MPEVKALVEGGKASAAPPLGPALAPLGVNIGEVIAKINEQTKEFAGMQVPVKVIVDSYTKKFEIEVGSPPTTELIKKITGAKGSANPKAQKSGEITISQAIDIARKKTKNMNFKYLKSMLLQVVGSCNAMGVYVEGMTGAQITKEIKEGKYDALIEESLKKK
ncbi:MAG: 50S ribosomal protein L11 [Candidatus Diapherotrites archaeon]